MNLILPKTIYQTWYKKTLPTSIQQSVNWMLKQNPNYSYELSDDNDMDMFIKQNFNDTIYSAFKMLKVGAAKADLWRYLILFKNGGVYLDVDSMIYGVLDNLITDNSAIISREKNYGKFVQWCLIYPSNHPLLKLCIDKCVFNILNKTTNDILELTGPVVYSQAIREYFNDNEVYSKSDEELNKYNDTTKVKVYSWDYDGYAAFSHPDKHLLYTDKIHWRNEKEQF